MKTILNCIKALARRLQPPDIAEGEKIEQRICAAYSVTNTKELGLRVTAKSFSISTDKHKSSNHLSKEGK